MGSGAVIYVPSFIKIGSGVQMLIGRDTQTHTDSNVISLVYYIFFKIRVEVVQTTAGMGRMNSCGKFATVLLCFICMWVN
jgi:hypothetical protein